MVDTIERGDHGLTLNFTTSGACSARETGDPPPDRVEKWFLERMSDSMQMVRCGRSTRSSSPSGTRGCILFRRSTCPASIGRGASGVALGASIDRPFFGPRGAIDDARRRPETSTSAPR